MTALTRDANVCGSNFSYQHHHRQRFLDDMVDLGLSTIELWGIAPHLYLPHASADEVRRLRREFTERELTLYSLTPEQVVYPVNIASGDPVLRQASVDLFLRGAEVCSELEGRYLFLTPGRGYEDEPASEGWKRAVDSIATIAGRAETLGVDCLFEPLQRVESNLVNNTADMKRMVAEIGAPNLSMVLDTVAMAVAGESVQDYFTAFPGQVAHVHFVDGTPAGHLAWGDGELPLADYFRDLVAQGYEGRMTFEIFGDGSYALDPRPVLERCLAAFDAAVAAPVH